MRTCLSLDKQAIALAEMPDYVDRVAIYREFNALFLHRDPAGLAELLIEGLVRAGAARRENGYLVPAAKE